MHEKATSTGGQDEVSSKVGDLLRCLPELGTVTAALRVEEPD